MLYGLEIGHLVAVVQSRILSWTAGCGPSATEECPKQSKRQQHKGLLQKLGSQQKLEPMQQQQGRQLEQGRQLQ